MSMVNNTILKHKYSEMSGFLIFSVFISKLTQWAWKITPFKYRNDSLGQFT
jgi:hypothetical protein